MRVAGLLALKCIVFRMLLKVALCGIISTLAASESDTCPADDPGCGRGRPNLTSTGKYYWPMAMGHPEYYSNPPWPGPKDLPSAFSWEWFGPTNTRYEDSFVGAVIDDNKDIYVIGDHNVFKLSARGQLLWQYRIPGSASSAADGPVIYQGSVNGATTDGKIYSVDMKTGMENWVTQVSNHDGGEYSQLAAHQGVVVVQGDRKCQSRPWPACACEKTFGLNYTDGKVLWTYQASEVLWDWFPQFPDDESVIFMDKTGALYKLELQTGREIWKVGGTPDTWTDGSQFVAANGLSYTVEVTTNRCHQPGGKGHVWECEGYVTAYNSRDGSQVWRVLVPKPPNTSPVVGYLGKKNKRLSLVMGIGQQSQEGCTVPAGAVYEALSFLPEGLRSAIFGLAHRFSVWLGDDNGWIWGTQTRTHDVMALDAETGRVLWSWSGPTSHRKCNRGDEDGFVHRLMRGKRGVCCPTPWGQPRIDSEGTIFIANENGDMFAIRDTNEDGIIDDQQEVSVFHTGATFPHCGTAHAPGMMVAVNFDGVFTFRY